MAIYSIWVLEYACVPTAAAGAIVYGDYDKPPRKLPYAYILLRGPGVVAMVDVGYNAAAYGGEMADRFGVRGWRPPSAVLAEAGLRPEDVGHVLLTHAHFDHAGNTDAFPNAVFYMQERELSKWVWARALDARFRWLMAATDPSDIMRLAELAAAGRLVSINGDLENVLPGIDLRAAHDTHTWGSQFVTIRNDGRRASDDVWVMAGDLVYSFDNITGPDPASPQYTPIGLAQCSQANLILATDAMVKLVGGETRRVIPVHEDALAKVYPHRVTRHGLRIIELALAEGQASLVA
jgi:N-acyl homoserine lactone hydrolase